MPHARTLALCCECGTTRIVAIVGRNRIASQEPVRLGRWGAEDSWGDRCTVERVCRTCRTTTTHAYLRTDDDRDEVEELQRRVDQAHAEATDEAASLESDLTRRGVRVNRTATGPEDRLLLFQTLDDAQMHLVIHEDLRGIILRSALEWIADAIARPDGIKWARVVPASEGLPPTALLSVHVSTRTGVDH